MQLTTPIDVSVSGWFDRKTSEVGAEQSRQVNYPHCAARRLAAAAALGAITGLQGMASPGGRMMTAKRPINKRKRGSPEPKPDAAPPELPPSSPTSSSTSEQCEQAMLDSFQEATAAPVEAFNDAAANATAFLQPSEQISGLARQAAKACLFCSV